MGTLTLPIKHMHPMPTCRGFGIEKVRQPTQQRGRATILVYLSAPKRKYGRKIINPHDGPKVGYPSEAALYHHAYVKSDNVFSDQPNSGPACSSTPSLC
jgi:hypothetical protein